MIRLFHFLRHAADGNPAPPSPVAEASREADGADASSLLELRDVRVFFHLEDGVARAVDGVSYSVDQGGTLGVVGESGCGKSVTALSILKLVPAPGRVESGEILFRGDNLLEYSEDQMRRLRGNRIGMIFQEPMTALNPVYPVGDQIAESFRLHRGMSRREAALEAVGMLEKVRIPSAAARAREYPHQLSGGMRQRVMIAMALACEPELLIADEPTTALDVTVQAQILELIAEMQQKTGAAVVIITHDLGVVAETTRDVAVMYAGKIVEAGPTESVFSTPAHPYTQGLMRSLPRIGDIRKGRKLTPITGMVPNPSNWPEGCRFHPRCPHVREECRRGVPPLVALDRDHYSACLFAEEIAGSLHSI
jgi:oligopeptide/dipeptide ABC transporter ATP-binding protein